MARVLLVEDDANLRLLYRIRLEQVGYEVVAVETGRDAMKAVSRDKVDIVVLDLGLPDYNSLQLLDEILSCQPHLPVIIHTGYELWSEDFRSWGAAAYVVKSPDLSELKYELAQFAPTAPSWRELAVQAQLGGAAAAF